ncbi:uncharacterized protein LOC123208718 [Mangifera indica]|uniref:uncharacterized protein LOC123208718 n=1 Tax=Mangifera indica TaxID=29780 RepID=UPI001CF9AA66|nr:uncharacterized protein LOC123208718 [Mangifera indica]
MRRVEKPEAKQEEFKALLSDAARPFLMARMDRFVNEMELFLASGLNIEAFDAVYMQRLGWNSPRVTIESPERESSGQTSVIVPHLHIFDVDSDGTDRMFLAISEVCFDFIYELTGIIEAVSSLSCEKYYDLFEDPNFSFLSLNWIYIFKFGKCIKSYFFSSNYGSVCISSLNLPKRGL